MILAFLCALFGLIAGSFLNVVVLRHGARSLSGRSGCMSCGTQIMWYDLIPVVSWIVLRGKCRTCGSAISIQYPLVELSTAICFALIGGSQESFTLALPFYLAIAAFIVAIAVYDLIHTIIPDEWAYMFATLAVVTAIVGPLYTGSFFLWLLSGPITALPLFVLWLVSGGRWMGLGDAKLALGIGWLLGPVYGPFSIMGAFILGAAISLLIILPWPHIRTFMHDLFAKRGIARLRAGQGGLTMKSEVPFGPFLVGSTFVVWIMLLYHLPLPL